MDHPRKILTNSFENVSSIFVFTEKVLQKDGMFYDQDSASGGNGRARGVL